MFISAKSRNSATRSPSISKTEKTRNLPSENLCKTMFSSCKTPIIYFRKSSGKFFDIKVYSYYYLFWLLDVVWHVILISFWNKWNNNFKFPIYMLYFLKGFYFIVFWLCVLKKNYCILKRFTHFLIIFIENLILDFTLVKMFFKNKMKILFLKSISV